MSVPYQLHAVETLHAQTLLAATCVSASTSFQEMLLEKNVKVKKVWCELVFGIYLCSLFIILRVINFTY